MIAHRFINAPRAAGQLAQNLSSFWCIDKNLPGLLSKLTGFFFRGAFPFYNFAGLADLFADGADFAHTDPAADIIGGLFPAMKVKTLSPPAFPSGLF